MTIDTHVAAVNDDRFRQAETLLDRRVTSSAMRLAERLDVVRQRYDLTWRTLMKSHREIKSQTPEVSIWGYWEETAFPESLPLLRHSMTVIDEEMKLVADAASRFSLTATRLNPIHSTIVSESVSRSLASVQGHALAPSGLQEIGERWQRRLNRAGLLQVGHRLLTTDTSELRELIVEAEMLVVDAAPWAHMDRLMMAFECAHSDIQGHLESHINQIEVASSLASWDRGQRTRSDIELSPETLSPETLSPETRSPETRSPE